MPCFKTACFAWGVWLPLVYNSEAIIVFLVSVRENIAGQLKFFQMGGMYQTYNTMYFCDILAKQLDICLRLR